MDAGVLGWGQRTGSYHGLLFLCRFLWCLNYLGLNSRYSEGGWVWPWNGSISGWNPGLWGPRRQSGLFHFDWFQALAHKEKGLCYSHFTLQIRIPFFSSLEGALHGQVFSPKGRSSVPLPSPTLLFWPDLMCRLGLFFHTSRWCHCTKKNQQISVFWKHLERREGGEVAAWGLYLICRKLGE